MSPTLDHSQERFVNTRRAIFCFYSCTSDCTSVTSQSTSRGDDDVDGGAAVGARLRVDSKRPAHVPHALIRRAGHSSAARARRGAAELVDANRHPAACDPGDPRGRGRLGGGTDGVGQNGCLCAAAAANADRQRAAKARAQRHPHPHPLSNTRARCADARRVRRAARRSARCKGAGLARRRVHQPPASRARWRRGRRRRHARPPPRRARQRRRVRRGRARVAPRRGGPAAGHRVRV